MHLHVCLRPTVTNYFMTWHSTHIPGLKMLTNQKRGDYYGVVSTWQVKRKKELGVRLLYRAMNIFLAEGERQLRPADIRAGQ